MSLWSWLHRRKPDLAGTDVILYTRHGCHLCEDAWRLLEHEQLHYRFRLSTVDVDSSPELAARYGMEVPVVAINGKVRFRGLVNRMLLTRLLRAEVRRQGSPPEAGLEGPH